MSGGGDGDVWEEGSHRHKYPQNISPGKRHVCIPQLFLTYYIQIYKYACSNVL